MSNSTSAGKITVSLNGEPREAPAGLTVSGLLAHLKIDPQRVAIELEREIVRRGDWDVTPVRDGAQIEIVEFVGGG